LNCRAVTMWWWLVPNVFVLPLEPPPRRSPSTSFSLSAVPCLSNVTILSGRSPALFATLAGSTSSAPALPPVVRHGMSPESLTPAGHVPECCRALPLHLTSKRLHQIHPDTRGIETVLLSLSLLDISSSLSCGPTCPGAWPCCHDVSSPS